MDGNKRFFIFSTLSAAVNYTEWLPPPEKGGTPTEGRSVHIKGGAGVANANFITPLGVMTEVDEEEMKALEQNSLFKLHKANGFISVQTKSVDVEKVVADMKRGDASSPKTPSDYLTAGETIAKPQAAFL